MNEVLTAMNPNESTTQYDESFRKVQNLTWLPWVGQRFSERPPRQRLLVVGESYYYTGDTPEHTREAWLNNRQAAREVASQNLVNHEWKNKTLDTISKLLFKTNKIDEIDCPRLWGDSAYYNFVQRPMDWNHGDPERPAPNDYVAGWGVFEDVVRIIQPSQCLFIGVEAAKHFNLGSVVCTQQVGRTWARAAKLEVAGTTTKLIFVQHLGKFFSWSKWHDCLQAQHPGFMNWLGAESYAINRNAESLAGMIALPAPTPP